jgi:1-acyl-sn-glycerol-3-phosphate acyltransferase
MRGRSGAIRLALETGVPVFPIGQWGSEQVLPQYGSKFRPGFWKPVRILVGDEVQLNNYRKRQLNPDELAEATALVMYSITDLVAELRGLSAPKTLWDPAQAGQATTGNFKKVKSKK